MKKIKKRTFVFGLIFITWLLVIFSFSAMNARSSSDLTTVAINILDNIREKSIFIDTIFNKLTENHSLFYIVRKMAHMFVFCVLQIIIFIFLKTIKTSTLKAIFLSISAVFLYACTDEFHQLFVSGRSGQFTDVMIDTIGGLIGVFISLSLLSIKRLFNKIYNKLSKNK